MEERSNSWFISTQTRGHVSASSHAKSLKPWEKEILYLMLATVMVPPFSSPVMVTFLPAMGVTLA